MPLARCACARDGAGLGASSDAGATRRPKAAARRARSLGHDPPVAIILSLAPAFTFRALAAHAVRAVAAPMFQPCPPSMR